MIAVWDKDFETWSMLKHVETTSRMLAGSCRQLLPRWEGGRWVPWGSPGKSGQSAGAAPATGTLSLCKLEAGNHPAASLSVTFCCHFPWIMSEYNMNNYIYKVRPLGHCTALKPSPFLGVASRRVSIRAPQRNPEDPDHTKHVPKISYCVVPKLCKSPTGPTSTFFLSLSQCLLPWSLDVCNWEIRLKVIWGLEHLETACFRAQKACYLGLELHGKMNLQGSPGVTRRHQVTKSHQVKTSRTTMTNRQQLLHQPRGFDFTSSIGIILKIRRRSQETVSLKVFAVNYSEFRMIEQLSNWVTEWLVSEAACCHQILTCLNFWNTGIPVTRLIAIFQLLCSNLLSVQGFMGFKVTQARLWQTETSKRQPPLSHPYSHLQALPVISLQAFQRDTSAAKLASESSLGSRIQEKQNVVVQAESIILSYFVMFIFGQCPKSTPECHALKIWIACP